ncbi:hypothetical protein [Streptomyces sp. NPDC051219]|uniref:hypothetical protein n=1 Tax=Streptomyces sp. NPDC051219 TaxID=3155283 RepID=UPI00343F36DB
MGQTSREDSLKDMAGAMASVAVGDYPGGAARVATVGRQVGDVSAARTGSLGARRRQP